jgi:acetyl esterase/lipase
MDLRGRLIDDGQPSVDSGGMNELPERGKRRMIRTLLLALPLFWISPILSHAADAPVKPAPISLWDGRAPVGDGTFQNEDPEVTVFRAEKPNGAAMVICPGGGYGGLVMGAEGTGIAQWLNQHGICGVVLKYRLPRGNSMVPLLDAQRAIRMARLHSKEWGIDSARVGIIGFSAGGHLASTAGTHFDDGKAQSTDPVERMSSRPDFMILVYPVISMGEKGHAGSRKNLLGPSPTPEMIDLFSNEKQVTAKTPPAFLAHAVDDKTVSSEHSKMFFDALQAGGVPAKFLELPEGGHGLNGYKGPMWDAWQSQSLAWLAERKFISANDAK